MTGQDDGLAIAIEFGATPLLELLFGLVADTGTTGSADGATDDRARRATDGTADHGTGRGTTKRTRAGPGLVIGSLSSLTGDRTADGADRATDDCARGATDGSTDRGATERAGTGAHGLAADLVVFGRIEGISVGIDPTRCRSFGPSGRLLGRIALGAG